MRRLDVNNLRQISKLDTILASLPAAEFRCRLGL